MIELDNFWTESELLLYEVIVWLHAAEKSSMRRSSMSPGSGVVLRDHDGKVSATVLDWD